MAREYPKIRRVRCPDLTIWECFLCGATTICEHREPELLTWLLQNAGFSIKDMAAPVEEQERVIVMPARTPPGMSPVHTNLRKSGLA